MRSKKNGATFAHCYGYTMCTYIVILIRMVKKWHFPPLHHTKLSLIISKFLSKIHTKYSFLIVNILIIYKFILSRNNIPLHIWACRCKIRDKIRFLFKGWILWKKKVKAIKGKNFLFFHSVGIWRRFKYK